LQLSVNMASFSEKYGVDTGTIVTVAPGSEAANGQPAVLSAARTDVRAALDRLDGDLATAAGRLASTGLDTPAAREVLSRLAATHVVDFSTVSATSTMLAVEPAAYQSAEGADISDQEQVVRLHATLDPVLSKTFRAVEGFEAASCSTTRTRPKWARTSSSTRCTSRTPS
jgi:hypothetical protein